MASKFDVAQVIQACLALYAQGSQEADVYLRAFQVDVSAWQIGHDLLTSAQIPGCENPTNLLNVRTFAAQTLHTKLKYDFEQLPVELQPQMQQLMLGHVSSFKDAPKALRSQIALMIASLVVQLAGWEQPIQQLIAEFANDQTAMILLDILTELPHEARSRRTVISDANRECAHRKLASAASQILQLLSQYMQASGDNRELQAQVLRALSQWAEYDFPPAELAANPLLPLTFQALQVPELVTAARDCLCQFVASSRNMEQNGSLVAVLIPNILQLSGLLGRFSMGISRLNL
jgi:transportin-3